ncbi:MFS transporter [Actinocatenispora thailandica]|uniref:MFS transporter n=1 Tax=Actinocatenispora thailandica TaxID=227318 RepID=UPI00194F3E57|nr:MFS transporter [Actinocatenispora thailandica]
MPTRLGRRSAPAPSTLPTSRIAAGIGRYAAALRVSGAVRYYGASLPVRFGAAMLGLGMLVLIRHATGGYAAAGAVVGTLAVASAVGGPLAARVTDRYGPRRVLPPLVAGNALGAVGLVVAVTTTAPVPLWYAAAVVAGLCTPAAGSLTRARWSALAPDRPVLSTGFALESLTDDLTFVVGPVLATLLGSLVQPALAPLLSALLVLAGGVAMAIQRPPAQTAPSAPGHPGTDAAPGHPDTGTAPGHRAAGAGSTRTGGPGAAPGTGTPRPPRRGAWHGVAGALGIPAVRVMAGAFVATGVVFSGIQVSVAAAASGYGHAAAAGPVYGCFGLASMCAGLGYGAIGWRSAPHRRVAAGFGCLAAGCALLPLAPGLGGLAAAVTVPGLAVAPTVIAGNTALEQRVGAGQLAEAFAWLGGACALGVAVGSAAAGRIVDGYGPRAGFLLPVVAAAVAALLVARSAGTLDPHPR